MTYLILAQICLTIGTPNWVVAVCYVDYWEWSNCFNDNIIIIDDKEEN